MKHLIKKRSIVYVMLPFLVTITACSRGMQQQMGGTIPATSDTIVNQQPQQVQPQQPQQAQQPQQPQVQQPQQPIASTGSILKKAIDKPIRTKAKYDVDNGMDVYGDLTIDNTKVLFVADNRSQRVEFNIANITSIKMDNDFEAVNDIEFYEGIRDYDFDIDRNATQQIYEYFNVIFD